jgi:hypothetical protein
MKTILIILLLFSLKSSAQFDKPIQVLQASAMKTRTGGGSSFGFNNDYFQFTSNGSVSDSVLFTQSGPYRFDISAWGNYSRKTYSNLQIKIDGSAVANISVNQKTINIFSVLVPNINQGNHLVTLALNNHTTLVKVVLKLGLCYITPTSNNNAITLPPIQRGSYPDSSQFLSINAWTGGHLRGFNEGTESFWHPTIENNYRDLAATGANIIRHHFTIILNESDNAYYFEQGDLQRFDSLLKWGQKYNFYVNIGFDQDPHSAAQLWWGNKKREQSITALWKQIATRYKDNKFVAGFSPLNEPTPAGRISEYMNWMLDIIDTIRSVDTNHCIIFPWAHDMNIYDMMQPLPYTNVLYEYHMYDPFEISTQGLNGFTQQNVYPSTGGNIGIYNMTNLSSKLDRLRAFSSKYNAPLYIGEFGCVGFAPVNGSGEASAFRWYSDVVSIFESLGAAWCAQSWRVSEVWDTEISPYLYYSCPYQYAEPTCNFGAFDAYRSDTTQTMIMLKNVFNKNK